ncbi:methionine biosynthesis protein MetW [Aureimonas fodinaquatilis]|uniref:Methionine biosynthesis protein MetW n=1 Tax=Aureimonas fodinaquatilis TaxID=2565783 RepID=A0A5B0DZY3_9HYPH|nr:methionine biosynthesis protein MetW [Aureimonas fodinaquatilis]KAA0971592.1 methionine biosynthesis protein MetW [Aureimonas fodinaquatilis]
MSDPTSLPPQPTSEIAAADTSMRVDLQLIADLVPNGGRVLDVGCGDGALLALLERHNNVDARGMELSQQGVNEAVARGLSVIQGDADRDLQHYPDSAFDYVVLSQTIQATQNPKHVLLELLRIGQHAIVSFPNFGHWSVRFSLLKGRMPVTRNLTYSWYDTPNIHFCTIRDFVDLLHEVDAEIVTAVALDKDGKKIGMRLPWAFWNLFGQQAVFVLRRKS